MSIPNLESKEVDVKTLEGKEKVVTEFGTSIVNYFCKENVYFILIGVINGILFGGQNMKTITDFSIIVSKIDDVLNQSTNGQLRVYDTQKNNLAIDNVIEIPNPYR